MNDVYIYKVPFPARVPACVVLKNDDFIVFINESLSDAEQKAAVKHELRHIKYDHIYNDCISVSECETEAGKRRKNGK